VRLGSALGVLLLGPLALASLAGCGGDDGSGSTPPPATKAPPAGLMLDFESGLDVGQQAATVTNAGTANVHTEARSTATPELEVVKGRDGGHAVRFPAFTGDAKAPATVLVATDEGSGALDPGDDAFSFGATLQLDEKSSGSAADNGDNLVQRGTFDSPGQLKIQLDHDVPSCRIKGEAGEVFAKADGPIDPGAWYSVTCERTGSDVELRVKAYDGAAGGGTWHASGPTGTLDLDDVPLTVGGKTGPDGTPVASADQFNGVVDDVFLRVE
jgi:hypothetical protein